MFCSRNWTYSDEWTDMDPAPPQGASGGKEQSFSKQINTKL